MLKHLSSTRRRVVWILLPVLVFVAILAIVFLPHGGGPSQPVVSQPLATVTPTFWATSTTPTPTQRTTRLPGVAHDDSKLVGGMTNHLDFARQVAETLLAYDAGTDFDARNADLLSAAAPTPYGSQSQLADLLAAYTPTGASLASIRANNTTVTVTLTAAEVSDWASHKLAARGAATGVYGIDITAAQTISTRSVTGVPVPVRMGVTVACPPAVEFCTLAGVFPQYLADALGAG